MNIISAEDLTALTRAEMIGDRDKQEGNYSSSTTNKAINSNQSGSTHYCHSLKKNMFGVRVFILSVSKMDGVFFLSCISCILL